MPDEKGSNAAHAPDIAGASSAAEVPADAAASFDSGRWVAAAAFTHPVAAHIARLKLESDGFRCYLDNEMFVTAACSTASRPAA